MKNFVLLLLFSVFSLQLAAQIQRGDWLLSFNGPIEINLPLHGINDNLASVRIFPPDGGGLFAGVIDVRYALHERILVGSTFGLLLPFGDFDESSTVLAPSMRYYFVNEGDRLGIFGEMKVTTVANGSFWSEPNLTIAAGMNLGVGSGTLLTPRLGYTMGPGDNVLSLSAAMEILLDGSNAGFGGLRSGQLARGKWMFGTYLGRLSTSRRNLTFSLSPSAYYFIADRLAVGGQLDMEYSGRERLRGLLFGTLSEASLALTANLRQYLRDFSSFHLFADLGLGLRRGQEIFVDLGNEINLIRNSFAAQLSLGGQLFLRENVALEFGPCVALVRNGDYGLMVGTNLGLRWYLP